MSESAPTRACPFCGEQILAVARKCKHCRSVLARPPVRAADVPWYRRVPVVLALVVLFAPAAVVILLTGRVYRVRGGRAVPWRGWGLSLANFASLSICILAGITAFESLYRPGCRSGEVAQLLGELTQRQVTEAQGLLAAALPDAQGPLKMSVSISGARDASGGKALQCVATARLKVVFPKLAEPVEGTSEVAYVVDPVGWAKLYVHVADAEWIQAAFGQARGEYVRRVGDARQPPR
jgi:hypothetical protein